MDEKDETTSLISATQSTIYGTAAAAADTVLEAVEPATLSWKDLRVSVTKGGRQLLQGVTGLARPGELVALMGAR
ncbi:unnamed protein product [Strongylus vulgaris]|uniref:ABC transporter domain-containing protein n=1 Tax=Strongylus vulgaris TaxID=40348 RepID=A0A3P7KSE9_STRVU|nr:unnamed protein product [Strongylus vulgaris]VDM73435.1 unnamed protein product [Strongylus vulgaris]